MWLYVVTLIFLSSKWWSKIWYRSHSLLLKGTYYTQYAHTIFTVVHWSLTFILPLSLIDFYCHMWPNWVRPSYFHIVDGPGQMYYKHFTNWRSKAPISFASIHPAKNQMDICKWDGCYTPLIDNLKKNANHSNVWVQCYI